MIPSPGRSPKQPLPGIGLHDPLHGREACPEFNSFNQRVGQIYSREGLFSYRLFPKRGRVCYIPAPPQSLNDSPTLRPRGPAFAMPWRPTVYPPGSAIPQAAARNTCPGPRQQHPGFVSGSAATSHQLRERQDKHRAGHAAPVARPDALPGRHVCFSCRTAGRPQNHPYKACA